MAIHTAKDACTAHRKSTLHGSIPLEATFELKEASRDQSLKYWRNTGLERPVIQVKQVKSLSPAQSANWTLNVDVPGALALSPSLPLSLSLSLHPPAPVMSPYSLPHIKYNNPAKRIECLLKPAPLPIPLAFALL